MLDIVLNRQGGVPVRDQLVTQLELRILSGTLGQGQKLPSVRALARTLKVHHNTVSAAYQDLEKAGHVDLRRGAGVFVRKGGPGTFADARGLDEMIRLALHAAFAKGHRGPEIRAAVERWLAAAPPERVVVADPVREMAELLAHEVRQAVPLPVACCSIDELARDPGLLAGALGVVLPYHVETVRRIAPAASLEVVTLEVPAQEREAVLALPGASIVLVVSHSPTVLPFASVFFGSLRGDDLLVEACLLSDPRWRRAVRAADLVLADVLSAPTVARARPRRLREVRVVPAAALARLRSAVSVVSPR
ncbi:MAG TPA: GntR family transcriptional regulator [Vicinamibacteria bacterium]|jgi:DNA-binding transcriptional regulator YhcF (GntR family)